MVTATTKIRRTLQESSRTDKVQQVDRAAGVIRGVKVLGRSSGNRHGLNVAGTDYTPEALEAGRSLYEGCRLYVDHPPRSNPNAERSVRDLVGVLRGVARKDDGLYGDIHYPPDSIDGKRIADIAESMPECLGLSHNAVGSGLVRNNRYVIESIDAVRSVDIVTRPATTRGLYESQEQVMPKPISEALGALKLGDTITKRVLEMDGMDGDLPAVNDAGGDYKHHLGEMIKAIIADESLSAEDMKSKIMAALKVADDKKGETETETETEPESETEKPTMESLQADLKRLKDREAVRDLCESEEFVPSAVQFEAIAALPAARRKEFIADAKKAGLVRRAAPRSGGRNIQESREQPAAATDPKAAASRWLS